jgi:CTP synthase (UTP-ammonia lyase)
MSEARIALVGDFSPDIPAHRAIDESFRLCRETLEIAAEATWVHTDSIQPDDDKLLSAFHGLWCVPGSPYANTDGALWAIQFARTRSIPFLGTCGGFQHALLEFARNELHLADASHEESQPGAALPLISKLHCALVEKSQTIRVTGHGQFAKWFGSEPRAEQFQCRFGLNPEHEPLFRNTALQIVARSDDGEVRAVELIGHPFFIGTLFQPERAAMCGEVHPLVRAFVLAARR